MKYRNVSEVVLKDNEYIFLRILWEVAESKEVICNNGGKRVIAGSWVNDQLVIFLKGWADVAKYIETKLNQREIVEVFSTASSKTLDRRIRQVIDSLEKKNIISRIDHSEKTGKKPQRFTVNGLYEHIEFDDWVRGLDSAKVSSSTDSQSPPPAQDYIFSTVPRETSIAFVGRGGDLDRIHRALTDLEPNKFLSIVGIGGGGKTELCRQYGKYFKSSYPGGICWIPIRGNNSYASQILSFAASAGYEVRKGIDPKVELQRLWSSWKRERTLLIFDDVEDPDRFEELQDFLPEADERFKILVNTRHRNISSQAIDYQIDDLTEDSTFELLSQMLAGYQAVVRKDTSDRIAAFMQGLPLGIELVGGYIREAIRRGIDLEKVADDLENRRELSKVFSGQSVLTEDGFARGSAYRSVEEAFDLSWKEFSKMEQFTAHTFLMLDNTRTSVEDIEDLSAIKNQVEAQYNQQASNLYSVFNKLTRVCVIKVDLDRKTNWHLLFKDFIKSRMSEQERAEWNRTFVQ